MQQAAQPLHYKIPGDVSGPSTARTRRFLFGPENES